MIEESTKVMTLKNIRLWSCLLLCALLCALMSAACSLNGNRTASVLVILVDQLGFHNISCSDNSIEHTKNNPWQGISGFQILCNESVRFTHAYTPSTLSMSAAASIFSAKYPIEHGLRHNGIQFLSTKFRTAAEVAVSKNYRTSFFSGGPPIFRKSGIGQGFEIFDDNIQANLKRFYRPAAESIKVFLNWLDLESSRNPYFSSIYLADLQFEDVTTTNSRGEVREASFSSQIEYLDETLGNLFQEMKKKKIWDLTNIVVVGLNGHTSEEHEELRALNLYSEGTHVSLFIKPVGEDKKAVGNFDSEVSLVDLGTTLFDLLGEKPEVPSEPFIKSISFKDLLKERVPADRNKRIIISESAWAKWRNLGEIRYSARANNLLIINDKSLRVFDTREDSGELVNLGSSALHKESFLNIRDFFISHQFASFDPLKREQRAKFQIAQELWRGTHPSNELLLRLAGLSEKKPLDMQILNWKAIWDLRLDRWKQLRSSGVKASNPIWKFVAGRNLKEKLEIPVDPCLNLIKDYSGGRTNLNIRDCRSEDFSDLITWLDDSQMLSVRQRAMESFLRLHTDKILLDRISELNFLTGMNWDVSLSFPKEPSISDLILALPENRKFRQVLNRRIAELSL